MPSPANEPSAHLAPVVTGLMLTCLMTFVVPGKSTLLVLGPTVEFLARWPVARMSAWMIAFPAILVVMPLVRRLVGRLVAAPQA